MNEKRGNCKGCFLENYATNTDPMLTPRFFVILKKSKANIAHNISCTHLGAV
jgi:hypothetical protein